MVDKIKFTVIVPTRERADTLYHCLQTLVRQRYENFEILVSDNFSRDNTEQVVRSICDSRIKYINTGRRVGMSRNYEFALSHVKDGWITYLGDDDGLVPDALALANNVIRETGCKALSSKWHHYTWPNFDGTLPPNFLRVRIGRGYRVRNAKAALRQSLKGRLDYLELPKVYIGGFAEYETLNRLRDESGYFFVSRNPDVYAAVALSLALDRYVYLHEPLSICGASAHSIGASHFKVSTNSSASAKYHAEEEIPFHPSLGDGRVRSMQLLLYEAFLQASHLHHNYAFTSTSEQLALSMASADDPSVSEYCREIAKCQGIDFRLVKKSARRIFFGHRVRAIYRDVPHPLPWFQVDGGLLGLRNILDATIAANSLYFQMTSNKSWKVRKVFKALSNRKAALASLILSLLSRLKRLFQSGPRMV
jgi:glycosyltransferase involved in cell wall biosynthesis